MSIFGDRWRVAVIGSAGRGDDAKFLTNETYRAAIDRCRKQLEKFANPAHMIHLVSGGSAWMDHIAVHLFLHEDAKRLTLYLPCRLDEEKRVFVGEKEIEFTVSGLNRYHAEFSAACGIDSVAEIIEAKKKGATLEFYTGYFARNDQVAKNCDYMIAFSTAKGKAPSHGGTKYTWDKCPVPKKHISLLELAPKPTPAPDASHALPLEHE